MPRLVPKEQKKCIEFLYNSRGLGPSDIHDELTKEFRDAAASLSSVTRELRRIRQGNQQEYRWRGTKIIPFVPWSIGISDSDDDSAAIVSQVLTEALAFDNSIPSMTSIIQARWIVRLRKAYPLRPAIVIWYAAYRAEFDEYIDRALGKETDYRHIERALQFQPWKSDLALSYYEKTCTKENIEWDKNWWKSHIELFQKAETSTIRDQSNEGGIRS